MSGEEGIEPLLSPRAQGGDRLRGDLGVRGDGEGGRVLRRSRRVALGARGDKDCGQREGGRGEESGAGGLHRFPPVATTPLLPLPGSLACTKHASPPTLAFFVRGYARRRSVRGQESL